MYGGDFVGTLSSSETAAGLNCIEAVAAWCQAVQGSIELINALKTICDAFGGELAAVTRVDHETHGRRSDNVRIVAYDRRASFVSEIVGFRVSCAEAVCGEYLSAAKLGSTWHAYVADFGKKPRISAPLAQRRLVESVVIPLAHHVNSSDFLEIHFPTEIHASKLDKLDLIGATLAKAWKTRRMGLLSRNFLREVRSPKSGAGKSDRNADILAAENPCRLSRAEYRVCLLLSSGLNKDAILDQLSIEVSTLRTHLRSIYAKTDTESQAELLQRLFLHGAPRAALQYRVSKSVA